MRRSQRESRNQRRNRQMFEREMLQVEKQLGGLRTWGADYEANPLTSDYGARFLGGVFETIKTRAGGVALRGITFEDDPLFGIKIDSEADAYAEYYAELAQSRAAFPKQVLKGVDIDQAAIDKAFTVRDYADVVRAALKYANFGRPTGLSSKAIA